MSNEIIATVGLPMFRADKIGFLALESLCRQENVSFDWELIVIEEEEDEPFTEKRLRGYEERLEKSGCKRIVYLPLKEWIPLSLKWVKIAESSKKESKILLLQAADCYSQPNRLRNTVAIFEKEMCDWVQSPLGAFFDVATNNLTVFDQGLIKEYDEPYKGWVKHPTALNMAVNLELLRQVEPEEVRRGVDGWMFFSMQEVKGEKLQIGWDFSEDWKKGVDTHGFNQISYARGLLIETVAPPFRMMEELQLESMLPSGVCGELSGLRLEAMSNQISQVYKSLSEYIELNEAANEKLENFRGMIRRRDEKIEKLSAKLDSSKIEPKRKKRFFRK